MKILKIISIFFISFISLGATYAYEIKNVDIKDDKTMEVSFDDQVKFSQGEITGDIKILKDVYISLSSKDFNDSSKITITLDNELKANSIYSLLSIFGADGSIDFELGDIIDGIELDNPEKIGVSEQGILKVVIKDSTNIDIYFNGELEGEEFEFKLLKEVILEDISSFGENRITIKSKEKLDINTEYILVIISITDVDGLELNFDEDIFDFSTGEELINTDIVEEPEELTTDLNAATEEDPLEDTNSLVSVASAVEETPDTGAETWILILATLFINTFYYFSRRKKI